VADWQAGKKIQIPFIFVDALGLARMELTFFIAALLVLCFGFVAKAVLMTHCVYSVRAFSPHIPPTKQAWAGQEPGR